MESLKDLLRGLLPGVLVESVQLGASEQEVRRQRTLTGLRYESAWEHDQRG